VGSSQVLLPGYGDGRPGHQGEGFLCEERAVNAVGHFRHDRLHFGLHAERNSAVHTGTKALPFNLSCCLDSL